MCGGVGGNNLEARRVLARQSLITHFPLESAGKVGIDRTCPGMLVVKIKAHKKVRNYHVAMKSHVKVRDHPSNTLHFYRCEP